jgi:solute carrier family 9B (sodium/hydrogen exchanger), member 1/2
MYLDLLWKFLKPVSFSLIGKEVDFSILDGNIVGYGAIALLCGVIGRLVVAYVSAYGANLSWKEKGYVTISGFPKATVQVSEKLVKFQNFPLKLNIFKAAIGPIALDMARELKRTDTYDYANTVLIISVLAIILTAPLGAVFMSKLAPRWLQKQQDDDDHHH